MLGCTIANGRIYPSGMTEVAVNASSFPLLLKENFEGFQTCERGELKKPLGETGRIQQVSVGGLEPPTLCLKGRCSTPELHAQLTYFRYFQPIFQFLSNYESSEVLEHVLEIIDFSIYEKSCIKQIHFLLFW